MTTSWRQKRLASTRAEFNGQIRQFRVAGVGGVIFRHIVQRPPVTWWCSRPISRAAMQNSWPPSFVMVDSSLFRMLPLSLFKEFPHKFKVGPRASFAEIGPGLLKTSPFIVKPRGHRLGPALVTNADKKPHQDARFLTAEASAGSDICGNRGTEFFKIQSGGNCFIAHIDPTFCQHFPKSVTKDVRSGKAKIGARRRTYGSQLLGTAGWEKREIFFSSRCPLYLRFTPLVELTRDQFPSCSIKQRA